MGYVLGYIWAILYGKTHSVIINSTENTSANTNQILANDSGIARPFLVHEDYRILNPKDIFNV